MGKIIAIAFILVFSFSAFSADKNTFTIQVMRGNFAGGEKLIMQLDKGKSSLDMNSNLFNIGDLTKIGKFSYKGEKHYKSFAKLWDKVEAQTKNKTAPSVISPHATQVAINGKPLEVASPAYYAVLEWLPKIIASNDWNPVNAKYVGFLDDSNMIVESWEKGKLKNQKAFNPLFVCKKSGPNLLCPTSLGVVFPPAQYDRLPASN